MATYAVGDIQGCYDTLRHLLDQLKFDPNQDILWVAGDMVNRGPKSLATVRYLKSLGNGCIAVLGNHDLHLLAVACGIRKQKDKDTLTELLKAPDADELLHWLRFRPMLHHDAQRKITLVHAGIPPVWTIAQAIKQAQELEQALRSDDYVKWLKKIFKSTRPQPWDDELKLKKKLRLTASYFTQMRFCNAHGLLDLESKGSTPKEGYAPWFSFSGSPCYQEQIIFGHWAALDGISGHDNIHAIDTGCVWGKSLTAINVDSLERTEVCN
ncbi:symmetrical bis(5'-nucleosyl)-tetraphosphatase [Endozoicomonas sp. SCSIO W0465]|uniref:symmetrical bis(5'-nucleosyl)-tetraphosphatase n=1 Tax=Endozoicomonas sp. SCSIO W0465 TaxID=2918516 RepID=UPI002074BBB5|nr:symmetrical bis(5'-nucleosyl)-tetraphosphatase [Endozoicomonas sp. SCSIO W0465]USE35582.1 symmetrical bis(5'-nucleosyl)-tetraphosphatase [Endozoicomonas sp. SCSIO W0465]